MNGTELRSVQEWTRPLPSQSRRRRTRKHHSLSSVRSMAHLPLAGQTGDARNGDGDAGLQRTRDPRPQIG